MPELSKGEIAKVASSKAGQLSAEILLFFYPKRPPHESIWQTIRRPMSIRGSFVMFVLVGLLFTICESAYQWLCIDR